MDPRHEDRIRARAYQLWLDNGSPENMAEHFWLMAEEEIAQAGVQADAAAELEEGEAPGQLAEDITGTESGRTPSRGRGAPKGQGSR